MDMSHRIRALINRIARLDAAHSWEGDLNPAQRGALEYLVQANMYSRAPSHVAEYFGTTRGTMSQTLKVLARKGYVSEETSKSDKRSISYTPTDAGSALIAASNPISAAFEALNPDEQAELEKTLRRGLQLALKANGGQSFGLCKTCEHYDPQEVNGFCKLLSVSLSKGENNKICVEHKEVAVVAS
ncbi:winged helix-turn-helix transcriptional regulator [Rhodobacteraceae bacterium B1Z28]|uniref:Winged helix-turn-helix transcriptional regulator n=1 Tax=Ruegeria haliotis TaxID=2747601 RepID=A0ABX2PS78_9RHOB|nr:MarR family winged helix-turn-helix transcriptional regulator [Ruegeria haliotis]NVO56996.1 winged helix-turn-helix transcriptional regulator [Ruegeria haliotis]